jgi:hypothetical protein
MGCEMEKTVLAQWLSAALLNLWILFNNLGD